MKELFRFFLKLGTTGFGGPIAMIGMMEQHFVYEEKSISEEDFKRYVAAAKLFPGTVSTLIAIRIGFQKFGRKGGIVAGLCHILPSFLMVLLISPFLIGAKTNTNLTFENLFTGLQLGGLALSLVAAYRFTLPLLSKQTLFYVIGAGILTFFFPREEIFFLLIAGTFSLIYQFFKNHRSKTHLFEASSFILIALFFESFKASLFTYGTGMAIMPVLKTVYIDQYHWVSQADFLTAMSVGQITPGPFVIFNTYLAHEISGFSGACLATLGTFLPAFIFGLWLMPLFERRLLSTPLLKVFFAGMLPAVGGAILGSVARLALFAIQESGGSFQWDHIALLVVLVGITLKVKIHPIAIIGLGALLQSFLGLALNEIH